MEDFCDEREGARATQDLSQSEAGESQAKEEAALCQLEYRTFHSFFVVNGASQIASVFE
jgi:hypothetical protein